MKKAAIALTTLFLVLSAPSVAIHAQDKTSSDAKPKPEPEPVASTPIRLQFLLTEFEGDKKVKSLPYMILYNATHNANLQSDFTRMRIGMRMPIVTGSGQYQYQDVGTNLDCRAVRNEDGRFLVDFGVEHSWAEGSQQVQMSVNPRQDPGADLFNQPLIRNIRTGQILYLRDGQTIETTAATDPISGRVFRIDVTLNIVK
jgi:hypothetical protein